MFLLVTKTECQMLLLLTIVSFSSIILTNSREYADALICNCPFAIHKACRAPSEKSNSKQNKQNLPRESSSLLEKLNQTSQSIPSFMSQAITMSKEMCKQYNESVAFAELKASGLYFYNRYQHIALPNISPFISAGGYSSFAHVHMGISKKGYFERPIIPEITRPYKKQIIIHIQGNHALLIVVELFKLESLQRFKKVIIIVDHSDRGFPSGNVFTYNPKERLKNAERYGKAIQEQIQKKASNQTWQFFSTNYDDFYGSFSSFFKPIPLGLTMGSWIREQLSSYCQLVQNITVPSISSIPIPSKWLLAHFQVGTNENERRAVLSQLEVLHNQTQLFTATYHPLILSPYISIGTKSFSETLSTILQYRFVLCPSGSGLDTHRILEALMLGRIPIVRTSPTVCAYGHLPVLRVESWGDLTWELLLSVWNAHERQIQGNEYDFQRLYLPYWKKIISEPVS
jgi:hypothetical protein